MDGNPLKKVISHSGLPDEAVEPWFVAQIEARGYNPQTLSLEELREVLADILQDLILAHQDEAESSASSRAQN